MRISLFILCISIFLTPVSSFAQDQQLHITSKDSSVNSKTIASPKKETKDSTAVKIHSPRAAAIRSAILPGLGQVYNKKYWKLPIVYGALGVSAGIFFYNLGNYKDTRFAYNVKYNMRVNHTDSALYSQVRDV